MKAVFISGASTGIGKTCALQLDKLGFQVFVGVRFRQTLSSLYRPLLCFKIRPRIFNRFAAHGTATLGNFGNYY